MGIGSSRIYAEDLYSFSLKRCIIVAHGAQLFRASRRFVARVKNENYIIFPREIGQPNGVSV
jgi:hypothetical protein